MYKMEDLKIRRRSWVKAANINPNRIGWLLEDCSSVSKDDLDGIRVWLNHLKNGQIIRSIGNPRSGKGLIFYGEPGHGKTTLALAVIQEVMTTFMPDQLDVKPEHTLVRPCYFITFNDLMSLTNRVIHNDASDEDVILYQGILGNYESDSQNVRVLIVDDLGKEHKTASGWNSSVFHQVLRTRFNNGLPTIITTNVGLENWAGEYGDATKSLAHEAFMYMPIKTADLRVKK